MMSLGFILLFAGFGCVTALTRSLLMNCDLLRHRSSRRISRGDLWLARRKAVLRRPSSGLLLCADESSLRGFALPPAAHAHAREAEAEQGE